MNKLQLRTQLAKRLHLADVQEDLWKYLVDKDYVKDALDLDYKEGLPTLINEAKELRLLTQRLAKRTTPPGRKANIVARPFLQAHERARAQALAEWLGHHVAALPRVRHIRERLFAGGALSAEQAKTLLESPALRILSWDQCTTLGIPLASHKACIINSQDNVTETQRIVDVTIRITWADGAYEGPFHWEQDHTRRGPRLKPDIQLPFCVCVEDWLVEVWPNSVLDELHECRRWLAHRYPWYETDALWFVLTGEYPQVSPLELREDIKESRDFYRHRIKLSIDPWVSVKTVARAYRAAQDMMLAGRDNRPVGARSLALVRFAASKRNPQGKRPPWKSLLEEWNRTCPDPAWAYDRVSTFAKAVDRAELNLRFPNYYGTKRPGDKRALPNATLEGVGPLWPEAFM